MRRWRSERGAELVEFALVLPLLLLVALGILDFGLLFQRYEVVTNAAREGARVGVLPGYAPADADARARQYLQLSGLTPELADIPAATPQVVDVNGKCIELMSLTVRYPHEFLFVGGIVQYFGGELGPKYLEATVTMRNESPSGACT
jgi:hypothetical protein